MLKHKGFPSRMPGTDFQFTIRHNKRKPPVLTAKKRKKDALKIFEDVDRMFLKSLIDYFGDKPFVRGNLDCGRLGWLFGREVVAANDFFDPADYDAMLKVDFDVVRKNYPGFTV